MIAVEAFLFALSIAVGLTNVMFTVNSVSCFGSDYSVEKKTIVKNLNSIQNFGAMDILCTDEPCI